MRWLVLFFCLTFMVAGTAKGGIMHMTLTGISTSSVVNFSLSGSDAATNPFFVPVYSAFMFTIIDDFDPFPLGVNGADYGFFPLASGGGTISKQTGTTTTTIAVTGIFLQDGVPAGNRFGVAYNNSIIYKTGDIFEWEGSGTFDLSSKGLKFGDLVQGFGNARCFLSTRDMGIDGDINIVSIPEPSTFVLIGMGGIGLIAYGWRRWKANRIVVCFIALLVSTAGMATADVFNMGPGLTSLEMVPVGNPGNLPESINGPYIGSVSYSYNIGKYETTAAQYCTFLNAVAALDSFGLFDSNMNGSNYTTACKIIRSGTQGHYNYSVASDWANRPVNFVSWGNAARFCNWLQNGQPTGPQGPSTTEDGAYPLYGAITQTDLMQVTRNTDAKYWLPNVDEWVKAGFYDPVKPGGAGYWSYPTRSDNVPNNILGQGNNGANYKSDGYTIGEPYYRTNVGDFTNSSSAYGTFDQGGNVWEWIENPSIFYPPIPSRRILGGSYADTFQRMWPSDIAGYSPSDAVAEVGFRIASVPEPDSLVMLLSIVVGGLLWWRRKR